jgi:D-threo-aldose 1-dehydrogenase
VRIVRLAPNGVETTCLGFGCAGLMRSASRRERENILGAAFQAGIRHFDVARMYGLGAAERELGRYLRGRRHEVTVATKFGLGAGAAGAFARAQAPARALLARFPALRRRVRAAASSANAAPRLYDAPTARASLETSLGEIGTDYVDVLFLHEPSPRDDVRSDDVRAELERARQAGDIRAWGLAGEPEDCYALLPRIGADAALQVRDDIFLRALRRPTAPAGIPISTFGVLSAALDRIVAYVRADVERRSHWSAVVGVDCGDPAAMAPLLLADELNENRNGAVVFSTTRAERIGTAVAATEAETVAERAAALAQLVDDDLRPTGASAGC